MPAKLITAPAAEPVSLAEARAHLRVTHTDEDALIGALITAAREHVESVTGLRLIDQAWELALPAFPDATAHWPRTAQLFVELPGWPLKSVEAVTYRDAAGVLQTLATEAYRVDDFRRPARLTPVGQWPATESDNPLAVRVSYTAGFGEDGSTVPAAVRSAILLLIGDLYENRQGQQEAALVSNPAVYALLWPHRLVRP